MSDHALSTGGRIGADSLASVNALLPHVHHPETNDHIPVIVTDIIGLHGVTGAMIYRVVAPDQDQVLGVTVTDVAESDLCYIFSRDSEA